MPTEVTTKGAPNISGLPNAVSAQKKIKVNAAETVAMRQNLPATSQFPRSSNDVQEKEFSNESVEKKVETLNSHVQNLQRDLRFSIDAESGRTIIRVIDRETREIIRTIPPEDISVMAQSLDRHTGVLFNTSV